MVRVADVVRYLTERAPLTLAEKWDNVGLLVGDGSREIHKVLTCLTLTLDVAWEAVEQGVGLVVSHHPVLFKGVQKLTAADPQGKMLLDLIAARVAVFSAHTAFDSAQEGINRQLAEALGLTEIAPLKPATGETKYQIVCMVPGAHLQVVQEAAWEAGAGRIGEYGECSFYQHGTGTFRGSEKSHPTLGVPGRLEHSHEIRVEFPCTAGCLAAVIDALVRAHPYEEPAYFVYPLKSDAMASVYTCDRPAGSDVGTGRCGKLPQPLTLGAFLQHVKSALKISQLQFTGDVQQQVTKVGLCCGSGGELLGDAQRLGCDAFLTGESRFHTLLEARTAGTALILAGHYATERPAMEGLARALKERFSELDVWTSREERDPLQWA